MKRMIFFIALFAALAVSIYSDGVFAMGSKGGAVQQQKEKKQEDGETEGQVEKDHEVKKDGEDFSTPGKGKEKKEKSSPKKKPRLKYRDDSKCPC